MGFFSAIWDFLYDAFVVIVNICIGLGCVSMSLYMFIRAFDPHSGTKGQRFL